MSQNNCKVNIYGGQAVIEGVMFAGQTVHVTAVRRKNRDIEFLEVPKQTKRWLTVMKKIPFIRGLAAILEASAKGAQHLNFSAEVYAEDEEQQSSGKSAQAGADHPEAREAEAEDRGKSAESRSRESAAEKKNSLSGTLSMILSVAVVGVLSFAFGKIIFTLVPAVLADLLFRPFFTNLIINNILEGAVKTVLLIAYIYLVSMTPLIKRLFQYHGAEHKVITAYENGEELTVRNVQKYSRLHYRCGSSFIIFTVIVGVIIYSFFHYDTLWERIVQRLLLIPVVISVSYEVLRFTNSLRDIPVLRYLGYPGLWLQKLTTKEPDDEQVEVAIASFNRMLERDSQAAQGMSRA